MKKNISGFNWISRLILLIMALSLPLAVFVDIARAADRSFKMERVEIEAEALPDASLQVTEKLTIDFSGQWKGFFISIPLDTTTIQDVVVYENGKPYKYNSGKEYGPPGTYLLKKESNNLTIDWSMEAKDEKRVFNVSYRVINAVKMHNDVAELYRKFIGNKNAEKIGEVKVNLKLPVGAKEYQQGKDIRIWGHGPLQGEVNFTAPNVVTWQTKNLPAYTFVEGRVVTPLTLFPNAPASVQSGKNALSGILAEEEKWADDANRERWLARAEIVGSFLLVIVALGAVFFLWRKYGRPYPTQFDGSYYRELPANYSPAELGLLWNHRKLQARDFTATIMDLARRKFILIEEERQEVRKLLGTKEVTRYRLTFLLPPDPAGMRKPGEASLIDHERELLDYLHYTIAGGNGFLYLDDIERFTKKYGEAFYAFWQGWTATVSSRGEEVEFFENSGNMPLFTVLGGLALFTIGAMVVSEKAILGAGLLLAGTILGVVPRLFKRRSPSGQEDFVRWQAFRRFLLHFSQMQRHEIPSLIIWEHFLVYAVSLGVAREVISQLELVFPNLQDGDHRFGYGWYTYGAWHGFNSFQDSFSDIGSIVESAIKSAGKAASKSSSGSGGGGGFSSGGGGGSGGSSYGGR